MTLLPMQKTINNKENTPVDIMEFVSNWNAKYPFDYLWRKKYNVPFGSEQHLNTSHVDMMIDLYEEKYIRALVKKYENESVAFDESELELMRTGSAIMKERVVQMSKKEIDEEFDSLDLSQFND